jgi:hypothetical protein
MGDLTGYVGAKVASMIGGFFGGAAILTYIRPKSIGEAFVRGSMSTGSAMIFSAPLLTHINLKINWENELMAGFIIGFFAYSILGMVANFLKKNQNKSIVDAIKDVKK